MLAPMLLPKSAVAARVASMKCVLSRPASARMARLRRSLGSEHMAEDRAPLLRQTGHVDDANALALEMGRHAEDAADGDDAGAADPGDDDVVGFCDRRQPRLPQWRKRMRCCDAGALPELGAVHGHE